MKTVTSEPCCPTNNYTVNTLIQMIRGSCNADSDVDGIYYTIQYSNTILTLMLARVRSLFKVLV